MDNIRIGNQVYTMSYSEDGVLQLTTQDDGLGMGVNLLCKQSAPMDAERTRELLVHVIVENLHNKSSAYDS